ncbi:hypothetical protein PV08_01660 [Exophiala spinifera]|uniref:Uncharacterized protein n=1 Tax=Exophiala spinifera TaxID=91928 RepID=A0A0D1Z0G5_9EURO|nr:uncharacterized protein PV08_01660 [Exophiala spinifera]KIW21081.1 hypothetical protein PV08_01660 [Exophiala spinifera]
MADTASKEVWQEFFVQHDSLVSLLDSHAAVLVELRHRYAGSSEAVEALTTRLLSTETLLAGFKSSTEALRSITDQDDFESTDAASGRHAPLPTATPMVDSSGLFSFDANPSIVSDLLKGNTTPKRKLQADGDTDLEHERKKPKPNGQFQQESSEEEDSFVRGVEARVQAKANRKKDRTEKKRKRQSDGSTSGGKKSHQNKRQKQEGKPSGNKPLETRQNNNGKRPQASSKSSMRGNKTHKKRKR